jgi:hypothetical protein
MRASSRASLRKSAWRAPAPVYHLAFSALQETLVSTQQVSTASRKSLTLLQMLCLVGGAALVVDIVLNLLV